MATITNRPSALEKRDSMEERGSPGELMGAVGRGSEYSVIRERLAELSCRARSVDLVAPDSVTVRIPGARVDDDILLALDSFAATSDGEGEIVSEAASVHNLYVRNRASSLLVKGSLYNLAVELGLLAPGAPFGPEATALVFRAVEVLLGLQTGTLARGRLTRLEVRVDLHLPRPVASYADACEDDARVPTWRVGRSTIYHKGGKLEVRLYDKVEETLRRGARPPESYLGAHVARVECVLHRGGVPRYLGASKDDEGVVRAGLLADPAFRDDLVGLWAGQARRLRFRRVAHPDFVPDNATDRMRWHAAQHMLATGGPEAEAARIDADYRAGRLDYQPRKDQKEAVRALCRDARYTSVSDLEAEFAAAVVAVTQIDH